MFQQKGTATALSKAVHDLIELIPYSVSKGLKSLWGGLLTTAHYVTIIDRTPGSPDYLSMHFVLIVQLATRDHASQCLEK